MSNFYDPYRQRPTYQNGSQNLDRITWCVVQIEHLIRRVDGLEREASEMKKDREALIRYIGVRLLFVVAVLLGAAASNGSDGDTLIRKLWSLIG